MDQFEVQAFSQEVEKLASGHALAGLALLLPSHLLTSLSHSKLLKETKNPLENKTKDAKLMRALLKLSPLKVHVAPKGSFGAYDVAENKLYAEKGVNPAILAHEMGHAELSRTALGYAIQNPVTVVAANVAAGLAPFAGAASVDLKDNRLRLAALAAPALLKVPQLAYEAGASLKGIDKLREAGASDKQIEKAKEQLLHAYLTYAGSVGATIGSTLVGHGIGRYAAKL